jgi:hypothetical protein
MLTITIGCHPGDGSAARVTDKSISPMPALAQSAVFVSTPMPDSGGNTLYQGYENGFMVLVFGNVRGSLLIKNCIYAYSFAGERPHIIAPASLGFDPHRDWYRYCTYLDELVSASPADIAHLKGAFQVLSSYEVIQTDLGDPVDEGVVYNASIPANPPQNIAPEGAWYLPIISLPDGSTLFCGSRAATGGTCYVAP